MDKIYNSEKKDKELRRYRILLIILEVFFLDILLNTEFKNWINSFKSEI